MQPTSSPSQPAAAPTPARSDAVDALLADVDDLAGRPLAEHVAVFEQVHARLQAALREIDA